MTKADINKRGYNKFLCVSSGVTVSIDESKIEEDKVWDGLKGYRTNTNLPADQVYQNYQQLWNVERAFRITKGTLEVRPMFHFSKKRIEAHVCICFVALKVYKELERLLKASKCPYSVDNVLRISETIVTIEIDLPENGKTLTRTIYTSQEERNKETLAFAFNMSLSSINVARAYARQENINLFVGSTKTLLHNAAMVNRFIAISGKRPNMRLNNTNFKELLFYGVRAVA